MQTRTLAALLSILIFSAACDSSAKTHPGPQSPSPPPVAQVQQLTDDEVRGLCNRMADIKVLPMKEERGVDATYDAFMTAGVRVVPCLIEKVTDETAVPDVWHTPTYGDTRLGDVAVFLIGDITQLDFYTLLPIKVQAKVHDQGVYAYFEYVEKPKNRKILQEKLRTWFQENFANLTPPKPASNGRP